MTTSRSKVGPTIVSAAVFCLLVTPVSHASAQDAARRVDALNELNGAVESLVDRVSQSVVQVLVTSYGPVQENSNDADRVIGRQRNMGSGVMVDSDGYIVTNAHVISNARRVQVVLPGPSNDHSGVRSLVKARGRTVDAKVVGVAREIDLALLKVEDSNVPPLAMADYAALRQGELVFAFGSPEGFRNSVTMGVVSAVARQPDADNPMVYVQTDAPINHGNSGGPLVNIKGELVGINTFIVTDSGGSQGLGFAIPSALVQMAYPKLRRYGHLHQGEIGILLQTVTPTLAAGLGLSQDWGAMISDVMPASPAAAAGLKVADIVVSIDGEPVDDLPRLGFLLFARSAGDKVALGVLRGSDVMTVDLTVGERAHDLDRLTELVDPEKNLVARLGILGVDIAAGSTNWASGLREPSGVVVVGRTKEEDDLAQTGLMTGDTIHSINGITVAGIDDLRKAIDRLESRSAVVLQIERNGQLSFLGFELE